MDYSGKVITKNPVTPTRSSAPGVWTVQDAAAAVEANNWPVAGVPNPILRSLRFNSADSAYLSRTPASAGNRKTWTWSGWVKRSRLGTEETLFACGTTASDTAFGQIVFSSDNKLRFNRYYDTLRGTNAVYRDVSAWYHIVVVLDTPNATAADRAILYVNNERVTSFEYSNDPTQNIDLAINQNIQHTIGRYDLGGGGNYLSTYLTEINFIDGLALDPTYFGLTDPTTGQWVPKAYSGAYGTNGFYLTFQDNSSTGGLGTDYSGNNNTWGVNNFSVTAGSGNDSLVDVPTPWIAYNTTGDVGGVVRGNYATLNPLYGTGITANFYTTNGNLDLNVDSNSGYRNLAGTFSPENFKGYFEVYCSTSPNLHVGFAFESIAPSNLQYQNAGTLYINTSGDVLDGPTTIKSGCTPSFSSTDVLQVAFDFTNGARNVWFGRNGTWGSNASGVGVPSTGTNPVLTSSNITSASRFYFAINSGAGTVTIATNFGQRPFAYTPPTGFKSLCTTNLPTPTIVQGDDYFNTVLYTGTGSAPRTITGVGFQPDFIWTKCRSNVSDPGLVDSVRGGTKLLFSDLTDSEYTGTWINSFDSNGYTIGDTGSTFNFSGRTYVAWNWKANGSGSSNTDGTITSTVSVNTTSGFSIVTYTGNGTGGATVGHGLGVVPSMFILKERSGGTAADFWATYHVSLGNTKYLTLNTTDAEATAAYWNNTTPSSSVITLGSNTNINDTGATYVIYAFAPVAGYSAFGSYTGNGSADGPFVYTGFRPAFVLWKNASATYGWFLMDSARNVYNVANKFLRPNASDAENTAVNSIADFTSNGFKIRGIGDDVNGSGNTIIYMAFAESPFKFANAR